jgi:hypothetical protein
MYTDYGDFTEFTEPALRIRVIEIVRVIHGQDPASAPATWAVHGQIGI